MENPKNPIEARGENGTLKFKTVADIAAYPTAEHREDAPFVSEKIQITEENVGYFLKGTGDNNPIHQTQEGIKKSWLARKNLGRLVTPGFQTEAILANKNTLWKALTIEEENEVINCKVVTKWSEPVPVGADIFYTFKMKSAVNVPGKPDATIPVDWSSVTWDTECYYVNESGENIKCMEALYTVGYAPLPDEYFQ